MLKKIRNILAPTHAFKVSGFISIVIALCGVALYSQPTAVHHTTIASQKTATKNITQHSPPITPKQTPPPTTPAPTPAVANPASSTATKPVTRVAASVRPEPVVTPSPSSNVSGLTPTAPVTTPSTSQASTPATTTGYTSTNWSGYMATSGTYTSISGNWTATSPTGNGSTTTADSTWIGIGGVISSDLIQTGTQNTVSASGQVSASAFYELLPNVSQTVPGISVTPGDSMSASLSEVSSGQWSFTITDVTNGESYTKTVAYASSHSSAEWIEEDPSYSFRRQIPFDTFGTAFFRNGSTTSNGSSLSLTDSNAQPITMVNRSGQAIATPSALGGGGASFSITQN